MLDKEFFAASQCRARLLLRQRDRGTGATNAVSEPLATGLLLRRAEDPEGIATRASWSVTVVRRILLSVCYILLSSVVSPAHEPRAGWLISAC